MVYIYVEKVLYYFMYAAATFLKVCIIHDHESVSVIPFRNLYHMLGTYNMVAAA